MSTETMELINTVMQICIIPLLGVLTTYLVKIIQTKANEIQISSNNKLINRYIEIAETAVVNAVKATNQTFTDELKGKDIFDKKAQEKAFQMTKNAVLVSLSDSAKSALQVVYGDLNMWLDNSIEKVVGENKSSKIHAV